MLDNNIEKDFENSMDMLCFSPKDKERIINKIVRRRNQSKESEDTNEDIRDNSDISMAEFPDALGGSYIFEGGNTVNVGEKDGTRADKWDDLSAVYKSADDDTVTLTLSDMMSDEEKRTPTEIRVIDGIVASFNYDEHLVLAGEGKSLDAAIQERMENDEHFFVSYSDKEETYFFSSVSFVKDGVSYHIYTTDNISADVLFSMAEELILR